MKIGFIGVGVMGNGMVQNLLQQGYEVNAYTAHARQGARGAETPARSGARTSRIALRDADAVITHRGLSPGRGGSLFRR